MAEFVVPSTGFHLDGFGTSSEHKEPIQVMQLDLVDGMLDDLLRCARHGGKPISLMFGKSIQLQYGTRSRRLDATPSVADTQVFSSSRDEGQHSMALAGRMSHVLAMQKAQKDIAGADEALAKLQNSLASAKQAKQSNQITYISDSSKLPPPVKQTAARLKQQQQSGRPSSLGFLKGRNEVPRSNNASPRPTTSNSSLNSSRTPLHGQIPIPTSAYDATTDKARRVQAIRTPLIHLLAIRPLSTKYLTQHINCSSDDLEQALQKVGKEFRLDNTKWDLNDKNFKELDVWKFGYKDQHDRDLAIERAAHAFDRMRLSQEDLKWQLLWPVNERGKGKTLSNLHHLHKGPIQQSNTPRIHVQHPEDSHTDPASKEQDKEQSGHLTPNSTEAMARAKPQDQAKKTSESKVKDVKPKRLQANGPKKIKPTPPAKTAHPAVKKGPKKAIVPKSDEFVHDSDEEDGLEETIANTTSPPARAEKTVSTSDSTVSPPSSTSSSSSKDIPLAAKTAKTVKSQSREAPKSTAKAPQPARPLSAARPKTAASTLSQPNGDRSAERKSSPASDPKAPRKKIPSSPAHTPGGKQRLTEAGQGAMSMQKSLSRQRTLSSPLKPSPLGSSPPTNASEFENHTSQSTTPPSSKKAAATNGVSHTADTSLKVNGHARSVSSSDAPLKRKANDLESGIHDHGSPAVNGYAVSGKRQKTSPDFSQPDFDSSSSTSPLSDREMILLDAQRFKALHVKYAKAHQEVSRLTNPPLERIDQVRRMHKRLEEMKRTITLNFLNG